MGTIWRPHSAAHEYQSLPDWAQAGDRCSLPLRPECATQAHTLQDPAANSNAYILQRGLRGYPRVEANQLRTALQQTLLVDTYCMT